jgi:hypothetical protein
MSTANHRTRIEYAWQSIYPRPREDEKRDDTFKVCVIDCKALDMISARV